MPKLWVTFAVQRNTGLSAAPAAALNDEFAAATWTPAEFTDGYNPEKYDAGFNPGYVLTPENAIRNTKKGEVKQADKDKKIKARRAASGDRTGLGK